jgi:hypothetical protein
VRFHVLTAGGMMTIILHGSISQKTILNGTVIVSINRSETSANFYETVRSRNHTRRRCWKRTLRSAGTLLKSETMVYHRENRKWRDNG